jgi:predicted HTH domain antitoxin
MIKWVKEDEVTWAEEDEVTLDEVIELYYGERLSLRDTAERLDTNYVEIREILIDAGLPRNVPDDICYLLYNGPSTRGELPVGSPLRYGAEKFHPTSSGASTAVGAVTPIYFLPAMHSKEDAILKFLDENPHFVEAHNVLEARSKITPVKLGDEKKLTTLIEEYWNDYDE